MRADRRLGERLVVAFAATVTVGVPFLLLALLVRGEWSPLRRLDLAVARGLNELVRDSEGTVSALRVIARVGDPNVFRVAAVAVAIWLFTRRRFRLGVWTLLASLGGALLGVLLKE